MGENSIYWSYVPERGKCTFKVPFSEQNDKELISFRKIIHINSPKIQNFGIFEPTKIHNIPISPTTPEDAQLWFNWLVINDLKEYMHENNYEDHCGKILDKFPEYREIIKLPKREDLLNLIKANPDLRKNMKGYSRKFWYIQAPLDLIMEE